jgi:hypothetical protein
MNTPQETGMNSKGLGRLAALGIVASVTIGAGASATGVTTAPLITGPAYEQVESIPMLTRPHSWQVVDEDTIVIWATAFQPYLVELAFGSPDLRFSQVIGVTQAGSRVYAKFDAVNIGGFRYPIDSIYKMTREEARDLIRGT